MPVGMVEDQFVSNRHKSTQIRGANGHKSTQIRGSNGHKSAHLGSNLESKSAQILIKNRLSLPSHFPQFAIPECLSPLMELFLELLC